MGGSGIAGSAQLDVRDGIAVSPRSRRRAPEVVVHTAYRMDDAERQRRGHAGGRRRGGRRRGAPGPPLERHRLRGQRTRALTEDDEPDPSRPTASPSSRPSACAAGRADRAHLAHLRRTRPSPQERAALEAADGVRDMTFFTDERRCPIAVADSRPRSSSWLALDIAGPLHVAGADVLTRLEFARLDLRSPRARPDGRCAARPGAPTGPSRWSSTARGRVPCCACACAARARCCRREGDRRRRRRGRAHHRRVPARGRHRHRRRRARGAAGHHLGGGRGALVPLSRAARRSGSPHGRRPPTRQLARLAGVAGSGVRMRAGTELLAADAPDPWWRDAVPGCGARARACASWRPSSTCRCTCPGWRPAARPRRRDRAPGRRRARRARRRRRGQLRRPGRPRAGGRRVAERGARPGRARGAPGVQEWLLDQSDPERLVYVVPRERDVVLGGTAEEGDEDRAADPATTAAIRARCAALVPALRDAPVVSVAVGLRPARPAVRLEAEGRVVHCYGHGGARRDPRVGLRRRGSRTSRRARRALRCAAVK